MTNQPQQSASIGVDFSGSAAYLAAVLKGELVGQIEFRISDSPWTFKHKIQQCLLDLMATSQPYYPELWIEQPFVSGGRFPQVALKLVRTATIIEIAALDAGFEPCFVHPGTWRKEVYGFGKVDDPKERARQTAERLLGFKVKFKNQHNICEAMMIAYYGHLQHHPEDKPEIIIR